MKNLWNRAWRDIVAVVAFLLIALVYFLTPISQGLVLTGHDNTGGVGAGQEIKVYREQTGEMSRWTNSLFGGMPTYQIAPEYGSRRLLNTVCKVYELFMDGAVMYVFILLLGFYILLRALELKPLTSAVGAVAWAFSSYFFIIIGAGHIWKVLTLAFVPPTIAGIVLCYRGKYLWGGAVTALFIALQILSNHLQMTYYFMFVMALVALAYLVDALRKKTIRRFLKATLVLIVAGAIGSLANLSNLYHTYEYSKETMRGRASLSSSIAGQKGGLDRDYITQWSYGIGETWSLLVPNVKGGASVALASNETAMEKADPQYSQLYSQLGQYWGEQPGTSGPVYVGALIFFLFLLGLFVVKGPLKWALLAATVLSIVLSWGRNFPELTNWFIDNFPLYNKFRSVSSILVIAEFTMPLLAVLALTEILKADNFMREHKRAIAVSLIFSAGVALAFALMPSVFFSSYISSSERTLLTSYFGSNQTWLQGLLANLSEMRRAVFQADAWRSLVIILIGSVVLLCKRKLGAAATTFLIGAICLVDLYQIDRRYLNDSNFTEPETRLTAFAPTATDEAILKDAALDYRVLNLATNTFNENETSYWHKSIGGYHPAKLGRYQDIIENNLMPEMEAIRSTMVESNGVVTDSLFDQVCPVINMLNTRYFILPLQNRNTVPVYNPSALGNAWFVDEVATANDAKAEIRLLKQIAPRHTAVLAQSDAAGQPSIAPADSLSSVTLTSYAPNELTYVANATATSLAVFSEIYYPGWTATIDGEPLTLLRADYILRAAYIPQGNHVIRMEYRPSSIATTETIAYAAIILLILSFLGALFLTLRRQIAGKP